MKNKFLIEGLGVLTCCGVVSNASFAQKQRPNILIIYTDEQSCWTIGAYGDGPYARKLVSTPNLDALASDGVIMTNHIANAAVSTPSRGQLFTGRYCHQNGASTNWKPLNPDEITLAQQAKDVGYETAYLGKWHLSGDDKPNPSGPIFGFDDVKYFGLGEKSIYEKDGKVFQSNKIQNDSTYQTDFLARKTIEFIKKDHNNPFLCVVSIHDPHMPFAVREPYASLFMNDSMPLPVNFTTTYPSWGIYKMTEKSYQRTVKQYLGMVKLVDDKVGEIVQSLRDKGLYDNTLILFTSDHGDYMSQHGLYSKNEFYEEVYRVPFIIRYPAQVKKKLVLNQIVSNIDVMPTLLAMINIQPNRRVQGKSFLPLLEGKSMKWQNEAIQLKGDVGDGYFDKNTGIITTQYHLMLKNVNGGRDNLLFDRQKDPFKKTTYI